MPFRRKMSVEEREAFDRQLDEARARATSVIRDGREFRVVRLPDRYPKAGPVGGRGEQSDRLDRLDPDE